MSLLILAKISMLMLNFGSGILGLSTCMSQAASVGGGQSDETLWWRGLSMPEPMLSLSMLILAARMDFDNRTMTFRTDRTPLAWNCSTILMGVPAW